MRQPRRRRRTSCSGRRRARLMLSRLALPRGGGGAARGPRIPIRDTTRLVGALSGGQRQLVARRQGDLPSAPQLLVLDEPTASLGAVEAGAGRGADHAACASTGRPSCSPAATSSRCSASPTGSSCCATAGWSAELDPRGDPSGRRRARCMSGQQVDSSARRQLTPLHGLADRLVSADPSSSLSLILSALGSALGDRAAVHPRRRRPTLRVRGRARVRAAGDRGVVAAAVRRDRRARRTRRPSEASGRRRGPPRDRRWPRLAAGSSRARRSPASWSVPGARAGGRQRGDHRVPCRRRRAPGRDELDLLTLYAGYAASAVERDRLLDQVTARNRVLETIREMLETLAGPVAGRRRAADRAAVAAPRPAGRRGRRCVTAAGDGRAELAGVRRAGRDRSGDRCRRRCATPPRRALADAGATVRRAQPAATPRQPRAGRPVQRPRAARPCCSPAGTRGPGHRGGDRADRGRRPLAAARAGAGGGRARPPGGGRAAPLARAPARLPVAAEPRAAHAADRDPRLRVEPDGARRDLGRRLQQRFLARIAAESARLGRLVDDLLDFSAIESGVMRLQRDWCDIALVVEAAVACLPADAVGARVGHLRPRAAGGLGRPRPARAGVRQPARPTRSATTRPGTTVGSSPDEARSPAVHGRSGAEVEISVADDGAGFPRALAAAPFDSARRHRSRTAGAGLGLSIARGIVDAHGGEIELAPVAVGTAFRIRAAGRGARTPQPDGDPHGPRPHAELPCWRPRRRSSSRRRCLSGAANTRALVVEDDPNIVDLIRSNLAVRGFDTVVSTDGMRALQLLETEEPDIVLLDLMLPEADGFELCRQIRERSSVAVIVVSARGGERDKVTALNMGADDYMTKPFSVEELLARITATLRRTRAAGGAEPGPPVITAGDDRHRPGQPAGDPAGAAGPSDADRVRAAARARDQPRQAAQPRPPAAPRVGARATRPRLSTCASTCGGCAPSWRPTTAQPLIITAPRAGYRFVAE